MFPDSITATKELFRLRSTPGVRHVHYNYRVKSRRQPGDPLYPQQDNLARAGFENAWNLTTGGTTQNGTPIVVAVLDAGFDADHEDLVGNLWRNPAETPGDNLDNDGNGLVDDTNGWNFTTSTSRYDADNHGTAVAGLLGAAGDNRVGVAGTNWDINLMLLQIATVADIIAAYEYVIRQRQVFNESRGGGGAFVVATNASFGIEGATCADFPVWGGMYDRLGAVGVLTAASVANVPEDVDIIGDMPTDCPSDFIIGVTNVDADDRLQTSAGYGRGNIDLAAPGEGSFTTRSGGTYAGFGSTSAAAPYVTGAVALLYASPCPALLNRSFTEPARAARMVKEVILASVQPREALVSRTRTGGILDVGAAQLALLDECDGDQDDFTIRSGHPNPTGGEIILTTSAPALSPAVRLRVYDALGRLVLIPRIETLAGSPARLAVDLHTLPAGYYLLEISDDGKRGVFSAVVF
ncbi:S8 family peptidase [Neolewinella litorea]|uniref:S8 family peptidase n=1 Tax=Neolewinella litorea TaxID=2562452 RepID=UPI0014560BD1|nr:S8 family peptidase [Neolewinella litorea]